MKDALHRLLEMRMVTQKHSELGLVDATVTVTVVLCQRIRNHEGVRLSCQFSRH